ncbi:efflux RND transporter permease subunit [Sphingomonas sp. 28-62-11]|uniref:efflux RND transporter permease subunit n=1 Tax=Sphingomonas sp. 28-62-11 TaxID=1970432 RepID=UPI000BD658B9|nr:MAG: hydrophobe/amphiphile efflux-1 family RND transporter [Sphingomonas sp. 28-62-11]
MISRIFIDRPIFAWVISIIIMLAGVGAILTLPIEQYPDVAPPQVNIRASYPGASAETLENSVTQIIEQQLTGIDGLLYFNSSSSSRGSVSISATFDKNVDPDIAQVQVQNKVQQAISRLPQQVQQQGLTVTKSNPDFVMIFAIYDTTDTRTNQDVSDYLVSNLQDRIARLEGVGDTNVFGAQYAMRIWLNPERLAAFSLVPGDAIAAIQSQNSEIAAGEIGGQPMPDTQMLNATVTAQSRLRTADQFKNIVVKTAPDGSTVRLGDVARVELGAENYGVRSRINGHPGAGFAVSLAPGADALKTAELVKSEVAAATKSMPQGFAVAYPQDATLFIKLSVEEVVKTLIEAIILVVIVMFVFLQNWRATLIPTIAVPVVLLGTFAVFALAGFSINTLTLFGLVLAIGLLVDDAIVVVENVERLMDENPEMSPREATIKSMDEITVALIAIALVLSAVFLPMAFFGGSTGVIYRQFSVTIVSAMVLSVVVALVLTPALTATMLKHRRETPKSSSLIAQRTERARDWFNTGFARMTDNYVASVEKVVDRKWLFLLIYAGVVALLIALFVRLPTGFLPTEDQGGAQLQITLPPGATAGRTAEVQRAVEKYFLTEEKANLRAMLTVAGGGGGGGPGGQNQGRGFIAFRDWSERTTSKDSADAIVKRATGAFAGFRDARVNVLVPGAIRGLGQSNGFSMQLQNSGGMTREQFRTVREKILAEAMDDPVLAQVRLSDLDDQPTLAIDIDQQKLAVMGLSQNDVNNTLSTAWGGRYVNDFNDRGRVKRVYVQGDAPYRAAPEDLSQWFVRASDGSMVPFSSFARISWSTAPPSLARFMGIPSVEFQGQAAPGQSSGEAMNRIAAIAAKYSGTSVAWSGLSFQERLSSGQAPILYGLSLLVVFLCLAALYESWTIPVAVLLVIPLGLVGAIFAVTLRGLQNDVYLQIGLLTTMGLAAKNAILMIEFAEQAEKQGKRVIVAAVEAARLRLRPILMTSLAFIFGVLPLAVSTGAGANSRIAIGTSVIGGMLTATVLAIFYIPLFFVLVRRTTRDTLKRFHHEPTPPPQPSGPTGA